jgi:hypothetical protein
LKTKKALFVNPQHVKVGGKSFPDDKLGSGAPKKMSFRPCGFAQDRPQGEIFLVRNSSWARFLASASAEATADKSLEMTEQAVA